MDRVLTITRMKIENLDNGDVSFGVTVNDEQDTVTKILFTQGDSLSYERFMDDKQLFFMTAQKASRSFEIAPADDFLYELLVSSLVSMFIIGDNVYYPNQFREWREATTERIENDKRKVLNDTIDMLI